LVHIGRNFTRYLTLSAGYSYQSGKYAATSTSAATQRPTQNIDIGTQYDRPLSRTRRTMMSFSSGTSIVEQSNKRVFRVVGSAGLSHQIGRTWSSNLNYNRSVRYVEGFQDPFFADAVSASASGFLSRRFDLSTSFGYSTGMVGLTSGAPGFSSYSAMSQLRYALTRSTAVYGQYTYYHYDFDQQVTLPGIPRRFNRSAGTVGLNLWLPLSNGREKRR
jgi:hypothetical protein